LDSSRVIGNNISRASTSRHEANFAEPSNYSEVISSADSENWKLAIQEELLAHKHNGTWEIVSNDKAKGKTIVGCRWVFKLKPGDPPRYKARLVAQGFSQKPDQDFDDVFSPVVSWISVRAVFAIAAILNLNVYQIDFVTAYLNGTLKHDIFMKVPEGLNINDGFILKLRKSLYGLKQSGLMWYETLHNYLILRGFRSLVSDPCVYIWSPKKEVFIIFAVYVDDCLILASHPEIYDSFKKDISSAFKVKDMGFVSKFLGVNVTRNSRGFFLDMEDYLRSVIIRFGMENCNSAPTPAVALPNQKEDCNHLPVVGALLYAVNACRPDLAFAVGAIARCPTQAGIKRILQYVKGNTTLKLCYPISDCDVNLIGYSDSDWGCDEVDRRSIIGSCIAVGNCLIQ
jgi:hypothetical protein